MLPHYLWKIKVRIYDKLSTRSTFSRSVIVSVGMSKLHGPHLCQSGSEDQWRLLPRHAPAIAAVAHDMRLVRRFLRLSTRQYTCTPGMWHCLQNILCDFLSSQHPLSLLQICGRRITPNFDNNSKWVAVCLGNTHATLTWSLHAPIAEICSFRGLIAPKPYVPTTHSRKAHPWDVD